MRIIIAPAKKMAEDTDSFAADSLPAFLEQTERLMEVLQGMSPEALRALWKCNDAIARQNVERLEHMDLRRSLTPAILAYGNGTPGLSSGTSAHPLRFLRTAAAL